MRFHDRDDAGRRLAAALTHLTGTSDLVVVGLPRGGVPVAARVAEALGAPLDVIVVRKLGVPYQPELAMGAVGEGVIRVMNDDVVARAQVTPEEITMVEQRERLAVEHRARRFRPGRPRLDLAGRHVVIVDDGLATGATARAACTVARAAGARTVVLAVPVAPHDWVQRLGGVADEYVALHTPVEFHAVGQFYDDFRATTDDDVAALLEQPVGAAPHQGGVGAAVAPVAEDVAIPVDGIELAGRLVVPETARGLVVFAHGSGSSSHSPRNRFVAEVLQRGGLATLLFDLLTVDEEHDRARVFDIGTLAARLGRVVEWAGRRTAVVGLPVGLFGASTGAAAALRTAATPGSPVAAVVSRGGRPDLADRYLADVRAPTLLVVGGDDRVVLDLNRAAQIRLTCPNRLSIVPGATHLFEEPGTLQLAAELARDWFVDHLGAGGSDEGRPRTQRPQTAAIRP